MDLEQLRKDIAEIDMQIIGLIAKRISIAEDVGRIKLSQGLPVINPEVEAKVIARYTAMSESTGLSVEVLQSVAKALIKEAVSHENDLFSEEKRTGLGSGSAAEQQTGGGGAERQTGGGGAASERE